MKNFLGKILFIFALLVLGGFGCEKEGFGKLKPDLENKYDIGETVYIAEAATSTLKEMCTLVYEEEDKEEREVISINYGESKNGNIDIAIRIRIDQFSTQDIRTNTSEIKIINEATEHPHLLSSNLKVYNPCNEGGAMVFSMQKELHLPMN